MDGMLHQVVLTEKDREDLAKAATLLRFLVYDKDAGIKLEIGNLAYRLEKIKDGSNVSVPPEQPNQPPGIIR